MKKILFTLAFGCLLFVLNAQKDTTKPKMLLTSIRIQLECTEAIDSLYNGNFLVAEKQFGWLQDQYPDHPLGYFLMALSQRWKIMPNSEEHKYDDKFFSYLDQTIEKGLALYKKDKENPEASFFLAAAYGFKAQRLAENDDKFASISPAENAVDYIQKSLDLGDSFGPEFLFGKGLYNYFRVYIDDNYFALKPVVKFFRKGNMKLGLEQLNEVANTAFYTRIEALVYLIEIYQSYHDDYYMQMEYNKKSGKYELAKQAKKKINVPEMTRVQGQARAHQIAKDLNASYPLNSYFERKYAEMCWLTKLDWEKGQALMKKNLELEERKKGYLDTETYRSFAFKYAESLPSSQHETSIKYFLKTIELSKEINAMSMSHTLKSADHVAKYYEKKGDVANAVKYFELLKDNYDKSSNDTYKNAHKDNYKYAKEYLSKNQKKFLGIF
jgi:hypothetical protein